MNLTVEDGYFKVSLSERNLLGLLEQFKDSGSAVVNRRTQNGLLTIVVERDEVHYHSPEREEEVRGEAGWSSPSQLVEGRLVSVPRPDEQDTVEMPRPAA